MVISDNAKVILERRYFRKNETGETIENWNALISRVAKNIAGED
mgnify:FL=1